MNAATSHAVIARFSIPASISPISLMPFRNDDYLEDDLDCPHIRNLTDAMPTPVPLSGKCDHVLGTDCMILSPGLMRRIENELKHDVCDMRTVFSHCRGLQKGSREFEEAYIAARIRSFVRNQRDSVDTRLFFEPAAEAHPTNPGVASMDCKSQPYATPLIVNHLTDLMSHLGIWVCALLGAQVLTSWRVSELTNTYLEGGRHLHFAIVILVMLALDSAVWFRRKGRLCDAFLVPGAILFLLALLPIFILHVRGILLAMN